MFFSAMNTHFMMNLNSGILWYKCIKAIHICKITEKNWTWSVNRRVLRHNRARKYTRYRQTRDKEKMWPVTATLDVRPLLTCHMKLFARNWDLGMFGFIGSERPCPQRENYNRNTARCAHDDRNYVLLLLLSSSSSSPLCRVFILICLRQTISLGNTVLQLFCCYYSWCLYR